MLYKILKTSPEVLSDLVSLTNGDLETTINAARHAVSLLCDPKGKFKSCHHDLNMLRVKLATSKDDPFLVFHLGNHHLSNSLDDISSS
jgi:hypothetical protein